MTRSIPPSVTPPSPNEWPVTYKIITNITRDRQAQVTSPLHGFTTASDVNVTKLDFTQVKGMFQINGNSAYITQVVDLNNFTVAIDSSQYYSYVSGGYANIVTGNVPYDPFQNIA